MTVATDYSALSNRELLTLAIEDWETPWFGAVPYLQAIGETLVAGGDPVTDAYGCDPPGSTVLYFLGNAAQWKGDVARGVKAELKKRLK